MALHRGKGNALATISGYETSPTKNIFQWQFKLPYQSYLILYEWHIFVWYITGFQGELYGTHLEQGHYIM